MVPPIAPFVPGWEVLCALIVLITLFIVAMVHMLGIAFGMQNLTMWAKSEYMQIGASVLILVAAAAMVAAGNRAAMEITSAVASASGNIVLENAAAAGALPGQGYASDPAEVAKQYILQGPIDCLRDIYWTVFSWNVLQELVSSISFSVGNVEGVSGAYLYYGYVSSNHFIGQNVVYLALFQYIQYGVLQISKYTMLQIFLPIGLILRSFPMTRGAGGLIIGFAFGFAFVFPMTYLLISAMAPSADFACSQISVQAANPPAFNEQPCLNNAGALLQAVYTKKTDTEYEKVFPGITQLVAQIYQQSVFYPMISLIITFTFIRQTGSIFGADLAEIGRGLIKII
jgi:hypothetical protein